MMKSERMTKSDIRTSGPQYCFDAATNSAPGASWYHRHPERIEINQPRVARKACHAEAHIGTPKLATKAGRRLELPCGEALIVRYLERFRRKHSHTEPPEVESPGIFSLSSSGGEGWGEEAVSRTPGARFAGRVASASGRRAVKICRRAPNRVIQISGFLRYWFGFNRPLPFAIGLSFGLLLFPGSLLAFTNSRPND